MTAVPTPDEDGNLPAALVQLGQAISQLIDPKPQHHDNTTRWVDSLYDQLTDEIPGSQGNASRVPQSSPPLCLDAAELKAEIDTAIACWEPRPLIDVADDPPAITIIRLQAIEKRGWRPQDVRGMEQITANILSWCESIKALLNPQPRWHLPNPCPSCNVAIVHRKNSAGETVRQPALVLTSDGGCECQSCRYVWAPYRIQILAGALGYPLPTGVLE